MSCVVVVEELGPVPVPVPADVTSSWLLSSVWSSDMPSYLLSLLPHTNNLLIIVPTSPSSFSPSSSSSSIFVTISTRASV